MSSSQFKDLLNSPVISGFEEFWSAYPRKVGRKKATAAYWKALERASVPTILDGICRYKRNKPAYCDWMHPTTFLNGDHWEDEYDSLSGEPFRPANYTPESLAIIAEHVKRPWCERGAYPRETLQACVDAGLLTVEQMEEKS